MTQSTSEKIPAEIKERTGNVFQSITNFLQSSIRNRLSAIVIGAAIIPVILVGIVLGWTAYIQIRNSLTQYTFDKLAAVQAIKVHQVEDYLGKSQSNMEALRDSATALREAAIAKLESINTLKSNQIISSFHVWDTDVRDVASDPGVVEGMYALEAGFREIDSNQVRSLYLGKSELQSAGDGSVYSTAHLEQHGFFSGYTAIHSYEDAFLIDTAGNVVYSVHKTDVFGTNLVSGSYKDTNLADLYQKLIKTPSGQSDIADVAFLLDQYTLFIGTPIYDQQTLIGMLVYQLPLAEINTIIQNRTGLTASAETYLVGKTTKGDIQLRTNRTIKEGSIGDPKTGTDSERAMAGESGSEFKVGSTGVYEVSVFAPLNIPGLNWAILTTSSASEIFVPQLQGHEKDFLTEFKENYGFYDVFLINPDGFIFYTVARESDYQTNILTGEYSNTNLGSMVADILTDPQFKFADFAFYAPSAGKPAAFFGVPVLGADNQVQMIVAAQVSVIEIDAIVNEATGLGNTGETYMLGQDLLGRSDSRFLADMGVETTVLNEDFKVDTVASRGAAAGESGQGTIIDYRGLPVLSVWSPVTITKPDATHPEGQSWALLTEIDESEALGPVNALAGTLALVIGLAVLGIGALAVFVGTRFAMGFVAPILNLTDTATQVAAGNMNLSAKVNSKDELGILSNAFNTMTSQLRDLIGSLEGRVAARTKDLATVAAISTQTSTIQDPFQMLSTAVHLTQRGFGLYHAHVFTYHKESNELQIVACGYKEGDEHEGTHGTASIPVTREQSLVARAARTKKPVIVNDVRSDPGWLPNPLLPDTYAELAVPMIVGDELMGVLDVQADHLDAFTDSDANIQMTLASQIATALKNAQSYSEAKSQADLESLVNVIGQKIQRATTVDDTLQTAIREIGLALGASRVSANIGTNHQNDVHEISRN